MSRKRLDVPKIKMKNYVFIETLDDIHQIVRLYKQVKIDHCLNSIKANHISTEKYACFAINICECIVSIHLCKSVTFNE